MTTYDPTHLSDDPNLMHRCVGVEARDQRLLWVQVESGHVAQAGGPAGQLGGLAAHDAVDGV